MEKIASAIIDIYYSQFETKDHAIWFSRYCILYNIYYKVINKLSKDEKYEKLHEFFTFFKEFMESSEDYQKKNSDQIIELVKIIEFVNYYDELVNYDILIDLINLINNNFSKDDEVYKKIKNMLEKMHNDLTKIASIQYSELRSRFLTKNEKDFASRNRR